MLVAFFWRAARAASPRDMFELVSGAESLSLTSFTGVVTPCEELGVVVSGFGAGFAGAVAAGAEGPTGRSNLASVTDTREVSVTLLASSGFI